MDDNSNEKAPHVLVQLVDKINKFYEETCEKKHDSMGEIIPVYRVHSFFRDGVMMYSLRSSAAPGVFFADILHHSHEMTGPEQTDLEIVISNMDIKKCGVDKNLYIFPDIECV